MSDQDALDLVNQHFKYTPDKGETWAILKGEGEIYGDCEDYALTVAWHASRGSVLRMWWRMLTLRYVLWYCWSPSGAFHVAMWVRGKGFVDNIQRDWNTRKEMKSLGYKFFIPLYGPMAFVKYWISKIRA